MSNPKRWRPLPLSPTTGLPALLVAFDMGQSDYAIHITDLANIWKESLDRKAICIRAWGENTTIDPSDTPENMRKFLATLQSALDSSDSAHDQTSIGLAKGSASSTGEDGITLKATCQLPGFQPLVWSFHLQKSPPSDITSQLVVPLIEEHHYKSRQVDSLLQSLKSKDAVIAKLADKLEATGTGLEHVFTALSGRKKVTRAAAQDKIKGLGPFSERELNQELQSDINGPSSSSELVEEVFGGRGLTYQSSMNVDEAPSLDTWWRDFQGTSSLAHRQGDRSAKSKARTPSPASAKGRSQNDDDDEFQVQSTPPHLRSAGKDAHSKQPSNSPTPEPPGTHHKSSQEGTKSTGKKLGAIGGKKQAPPPRASPPRAPSPKASTPPVTSGSTAKAAADDDGDETASDTASDADETASLPDDAVSSPPAKPPTPPPPKAAAQPKKGGLGRIGGGGGGPSGAPAKRAAEGTPSDESGAGAGSVTTDEPPTTAPKKLGVIGKRIGGGSGGGTASSSAATSVEDASRGRETSRKVEEESAQQQPRETSQERADRKREEIKKDLLKKATAGPAKKKRKF